jgi:hypothetical protein
MREGWPHCWISPRAARQLAFVLEIRLVPTEADESVAVQLRECRQEERSKRKPVFAAPEQLV